METPQKKIYGLLGYPVKHSFSPSMHNAAFQALKINAEYRLFPVARPEELENILLKGVLIRDINDNSVHSDEILGFNITIPYKIKAREILERAYPYDQDAEFIHRDLFYVRLSGAINTVKRENNKLTYWNTDAEGFSKSLELDLKFDTKDKKVLLIGCGGAGRAIIAALSWVQVQIDKIYINDIDNKSMVLAKEHFLQFQFLRNKLEFITKQDIPKVIQNCSLLINASSVGMEEKDDSVIDKALLHNNLFVYDIVYNRDTQLIKDANALGLPVRNGLGMLLRQGVLSFEYFTEQVVPAPVVEIMRQALQKELEKCQK